MTILEYYQKTYDSLIEKRRKFPLTKDKNDPNYIYCETHHILPKCLGGSNEEENLVNLTAREHFIAHMLLVKIYEKRGDKNGFIRMSKALESMSKLKNNPYRDITLFSSKLYAKLIIPAREMLDETKQKLSKIKKGIPLSEKAKAKMKLRYEYKKAHGLLKPAWNKGIPLAEETKRKMKATVAKFNKNKGRKVPIKDKVTEIKSWLTHKYPMIDFSAFNFEAYAKIPRHKIQNGKYLRRIVLEDFMLTQISKEEIENLTKKYNMSHPCGQRGLKRTLNDKIKQAKTRLKNLYPTIDFSRFDFEKYCSIPNKENRSEYFAKYRNSIE